MARSAATLQSKPEAKKGASAEREGHRETVEAIIVAFILALVVRGFEAQAFVIPTGSMAPTLMGRHKEVNCPQCGFRYAVNASQEVESRGEPRMVHAGLCVNCRYQSRLAEEPSFKGDRILVMMFPYDLPYLPGSSAPERWDVVVFRYPEEPEVSYIKRLVGLPGETIRIFHGDIYLKNSEHLQFVLARKTRRHQAAMQIVAYDDRHRPRALDGKPKWLRWQSANGFEAADPTVSRYEASRGAKDQWVELRYRHLVPDPEQWDAVVNDRPLPREPRPTLITDFYSYNTNMTESESSGGSMSDLDWTAWKQPHWVGDLTLESTIEVSNVAPGGAVRLELVKAGVPHQVTIDLDTGDARITRGDAELGHCATPIKGAGTYQVVFSNVDDGIGLTVNGTPVTPTDFVYGSSADQALAPTEADLAPAAIAARNARVVASDLVLKRDIYYTQYPGRPDYGHVWESQYPRNPVDLFDFLSNPARFSRISKVSFQDYPIGQDRFFMMGDNSPCSKDSRGWGSDDTAWDASNRERWEVPRQLITGKAFYVYWPHGYPIWPDLKLTNELHFPFRPYFERMKWIR